MKKRRFLRRLCLALTVVLLVLVLFALLYEPLLNVLQINRKGWRDGCYYNETGERLYGWQELDGNRYYLDPDREGIRFTGWLEQDGGRYYLDENGVMATGWLTLENGRYYMNPDGTMATGWLPMGEDRFYLDEQGHLLAGWLELDGQTYYLDEAGAMVTGWQQIRDKTYYFGAEGTLQTGWLTYEDGLYYLNTDGTPCTGWLDGQYLDETGKLCSGWVELDGVRYYLDDQGRKTYGWQQVEDRLYYLDGDGAAVTGWQELDGANRYFHEDGAAARGRTSIDGQVYYFTSRGAQVLVVNCWNEVPEDFAPDLVYSATGKQVDRSCDEPLRQMLSDCWEAGYDAFVCSGYRSVATQQILYDRKVNYYRNLCNSKEKARELAGQEVAVPGTSEHHTGLAVDIVDSRYQLLDERQAEQPAQKWLMENSWKYGFVLRYPDGTTESTGIIYEPWHYRYVGEELARELHQLGLCLEDYLDMLTEESEPS